MPGGDLDGVLYLRSLAEAIFIKKRIEEAKEIVVVGGGFIGLELAAVASALGKSVTVIEALPRVMARVVAPIISEFFHELHTSRGVKILCGANVSEIRGVDGRVNEVAVSDGSVLPADLVLVGIGVVPNIELARDAGLADLKRNCGGRVSADCGQEYLRDWRLRGISERVRGWAGAVGVRAERGGSGAVHRQDDCRARTKYNSLPWFWTDQYEIKLQMAGISAGHDRVVTRGNAEARKLSVFYFRNGKLIAVDSINRPVDHMIGRKLIASGASLSPEEAADESVDLKRIPTDPYVH